MSKATDPPIGSPRILYPETIFIVPYKNECVASHRLETLVKCDPPVLRVPPTFVQLRRRVDDRCFVDRSVDIGDRPMINPEIGSKRRFECVRNPFNSLWLIILVGGVPKRETTRSLAEPSFHRATSARPSIWITFWNVVIAPRKVIEHEGRHAFRGRPFHSILLPLLPLKNLSHSRQSEPGACSCCTLIFHPALPMLVRIWCLVPRTPKQA